MYGKTIAESDLGSLRRDWGGMSSLIGQQAQIPEKLVVTYDRRERTEDRRRTGREIRRQKENFRGGGNTFLMECIQSRCKWAQSCNVFVSLPGRTMWGFFSDELCQKVQ